MKTTKLLPGVAAVALTSAFVSTAQAGPSLRVSFGFVYPEPVPIVVTVPACPPPVVYVPAPACSVPVVVVPAQPVCDRYGYYWRNHERHEHLERFAHGWHGDRR